MGFLSDVFDVFTDPFDLFGGGDESSESAPTVPGAGQSFGDFVRDYNRYSGQYRNALMTDLDTQIALAQKQIPAMMQLNEQYSPAYNQQLIDLERQLYPQAMQLQLAERMQEAQDAAALQPFLAAAEDPATRKLRETLAGQYQAGLDAGSGMDPDMTRETEQAIRAAQSARGLTRGAAPVSGEALYKGAAGQALKTQRQSAAENFLKTQASTTINPYTALTGRQSATQTTAMNSTLPNFNGISSLSGPGMQTQAGVGQANAQLGFNWDQFQQSQKIGMKDILGIGTSLGGAALMGGI
jgi:hypothetical protein